MYVAGSYLVHGTVQSTLQGVVGGHQCKFYRRKLYHVSDLLCCYRQHSDVVTGLCQGNAYPRIAGQMEQNG